MSKRFFYNILAVYLVILLLNIFFVMCANAGTGTYDCSLCPNSICYGDATYESYQVGDIFIFNGNRASFYDSTYGPGPLKLRVVATATNSGCIDWVPSSSQVPYLSQYSQGQDKYRLIYYASTHYRFPSACSSGCNQYWYLIVEVLGVVTPLERMQNEYTGQSCPESAVFCHVGGKRCEAKGCAISVWQDSNGKCGNVVTTDCSAEDIEYCNNNDAWDADVRVCITGDNDDDFKQALQDIWSHKCCYSYNDWKERDEIKNMSYYMVDNYDPDKDKEVPNIDYNATDNSTVVVAPSNGMTGNAKVENATTSDLADYLAAIQANTAAIAANLEKLNITGGGSGSGSTGFYIGSGSGSGSGSGLTNGSGSGNMTIDWGEGEVEALTQEDFNTDIDVPGDIEALGNATYGQGVTDVIESLPIISALRSSGVEIQNSQCSITGTIYGHEINIDFCNDVITNLLTVMGTVIYGVAVFYFFFIVFTF